MSFTADPYRVMTIISVPEGFRWACDSCGARSARIWRLDRVVQPAVKDMRDDYDRHIRDSHKLFRVDTENWGGV